MSEDAVYVPTEGEDHAAEHDEMQAAGHVGDLRDPWFDQPESKGAGDVVQE